MKKKIIFLTISIFLVILILFSSSYALLFKVDETDKQSYKTGILDITSEALNGSVTLNNELPITDSDGENSTPYIFRITNKGNLSYKFNIMLLSTTTDNQIEAQYIKVKVNDNELIKLNSLTNGVILSDITLKPTEYIDVTLRVWLDINTPNTQIGKTFNAKITTEGKAIYTESPAKETLTNLGLTENTDIPDFSKKSCSVGCQETTVGVYKTEDDIGDSYYFRGDVENNYVYFAGFYWRIIRINGDGTIRMIYAGTSAHENGYDDSSTNDMHIGRSAFNSSENNNAYVGYMYGTVGASDYATTHANTNDSTIKIMLDNWYTNNIKDTVDEQYIVDAIYCNDRELSSGTGTGTTVTYYKPYERLSTNKTPSLKCSQVNDRFTKETTISGVLGNGALTYPIGLITADEASYAGVGTFGFGSEGGNYYLYSGTWYWTMSSLGVTEPGELKAEEFIVHTPGILSYRTGYSGSDRYRGTVRPVISISGTALNAGTGTKNDPFKIDAAKKTLTLLGLTENTDIPDFSKTSCSVGCGETTVGIYKTEDDIGDSYYFRGDAENNYVYFADKYWRIIRINGDGSIRMIYDGTSAHDNGESSEDRYISKTTYGGCGFNNCCVGYMYGTVGATTYEATHANTNDSNAKKTLDSWYENNIKGTQNEQYINDTMFCNDREVSSGNGISSEKKGDVTNYKPAERLSTSKKPTLKCSQVNDRFTKETIVSGATGNGALTYPIGLISADEVAYAGGSTDSANVSYYLNIGNLYWTMSPVYHVIDTTDVYLIHDDGTIAGGEIAPASLPKAIRPVISISGTALNSGNGTKDNPFKIQ